MRNTPLSWLITSGIFLVLVALFAIIVVNSGPDPLSGTEKDVETWATRLLAFGIVLVVFFGAIIAFRDLRDETRG